MMEMILLMLCLMITCISFEFSQPIVSPSDKTINKQTDYSIYLFRNKDKNQQKITTDNVPANSNITFVFPTPIYTNTNLQNIGCNFLLLNGIFISPVSCVVQDTKVIIMNIFSQDTNVQAVILNFNKVINPYPAGTVSNYYATIGIDISAVSTTAIQFTTGTIKNSTATFSSPIINTTSNLLITFINSNQIPMNGHIVVTFSNNTWTEDISNIPLAISGSLTCSGSSSNTNMAVDCSGVSGNNQVVVRSIFNTAIPKQSIITFLIENITSPPTTSQIDPIGIMTYFNNTNSIDKGQTYVTGLSPKNIIVQVTPSIQINSKSNLQFKIQLVDTINQIDSIVITVPSQFSYDNTRFISSQITSSSVIETNGTITITQDPSNPIQYNNTDTIIIELGQFTGPASTKATEELAITILRNGHSKMKGKSFIGVKANSYPFTVELTNSKINSKTEAKIKFNLLDKLSSSGIIILTLPTQLTFSSSTVSLQGSSINTAPTATINSTTMIISAINLTNNEIQTQSITITISIITPASIKTISLFKLAIYYESQSMDLVAKGVQSNTLTFNSGSINITSIQQSKNQTYAADVTYTIQWVTQHPIPPNGYITIVLPEQIDDSLVKWPTDLIQNGNTININSNTSASPVTLKILQSIDQQLAIRIQISSLKNPKTTQPIKGFNISSYDNSQHLIDSTLTSYELVTPEVNELQSITVSPSSPKNSQINTYSISMKQIQALKTQSAFKLIFNSKIKISNITKISIKNQTANYTINGQQIIIYLRQSTTSNGQIYQFIIQSIINSNSLQPIAQAISICTYTNDLLYQYSCGTSLIIQNTQPAQLPIINQTYVPNVLNDTASLQVILEVKNGQNSLSLQFPADFKIGHGSWTYSINSGPFIPALLTNNANGTLTAQCDISTYNSQTLSFKITGFITPPFYNDSIITTIATYNPYLMRRNNNTIKFRNPCIPPCATCGTIDYSQCLSCSSNVLQRYFFNFTCLQQCPSGTFSNNSLNQCITCSSNCNQCSIEQSNCTSCDNGSIYKYLSNSQCLSQCNNSTYPDNTTFSCQQCPNKCNQCESATKCINCKVNFYLYNFSCLDNCPEITFIDENNFCIDCNTSCLKCQGTSFNCSECLDNFVLSVNECLSNCPLQNMFASSKKCYDCSVQCSTCEVTEDNCTSCNASSSKNNLHNNSCIQNCPQQYYPVNQICQSCSSFDIGCSNCSSANSCLSCDEGYVFLQQSNQCLNQTPIGFINDSGIAVKCVQNCSECFNVIQNCTACSLSFFLYNSTCLNQCPNTTIANVNLCQACSSECDTCDGIITNCTKCSNASLFIYDGDCVSNDNCPNGTYANNSQKKCEKCSHPCSTCNTTATQCTVCVEKYNFKQDESLCYDKCPSGSTGINSICVYCSLPCMSCQNKTTYCTACDKQLFLNTINNTCINECPADMIVNTTSHQCLGCNSPCQNCSMHPDNCTSCLDSNYLRYNSTCVEICPDGFYPSITECLQCNSTCSTCQSSQTCLSCRSSLVLYLSSCFVECPSTHPAIINQKCLTCQNAVSECLVCTQEGKCTNCNNLFFLHQNQCLSKCPSDYNQNTETNQCDQKSTVQQKLEQTLNSNQIFPMPFTIVGCIVFMACFMSKLQNSNTYMIGVAYSLFGFLQMTSLLYLCFKYWQQSDYNQSILLFLLISLGIIYFINILGIILQTPLLNNDKQFSKWLSEENMLSFIIISSISFIFSYKFKIILFTKLFDFISFNALLQNIQKFRIFNILSFLGMGHQGLVLYICIISIISVNTNKDMFLIWLDVIIITLFNLILALIASKKEDDFFLNLNPNEKNQQKSNHNNELFITPNHISGNMQSQDKLINLDEVKEDQYDQFSLSISSKNQDEVIKTIKQQQNGEKDIIKFQTDRNNLNKNSKIGSKLQASAVYQYSQEPGHRKFQKQKLWVQKQTKPEKIDETKKVKNIFQPEKNQQEYSIIEEPSSIAMNYQPINNSFDNPNNTMLNFLQPSIMKEEQIHKNSLKNNQDYQIGSHVKVFKGYDKKQIQNKEELSIEEKINLRANELMRVKQIVKQKYKSRQRQRSQSRERNKSRHNYKLPPRNSKMSFNGKQQQKKKETAEEKMPQNESQNQSEFKMAVPSKNYYQSKLQQEKNKIQVFHQNYYQKPEQKLQEINQQQNSPYDSGYKILTNTNRLDKEKDIKLENNIKKVQHMKNIEQQQEIYDKKFPIKLMSQQNELELKQKNKKKKQVGKLIKNINEDVNKEQNEKQLLKDDRTIQINKRNYRNQYLQNEIQDNVKKIQKRKKIQVNQNNLQRRENNQTSNQHIKQQKNINLAKKVKIQIDQQQYQKYEKSNYQNINKKIDQSKRMQMSENTSNKLKSFIEQSSQELSSNKQIMNPNWIKKSEINISSQCNENEQQILEQKSSHKYALDLEDEDNELQQSEHGQEQINNRPMQVNYQAQVSIPDSLLKILQKKQKQQKQSNEHRINISNSSQEEIMNQQKTLRIAKPPVQISKTTKNIPLVQKNRMYFAGLQQMETNKHSKNESQADIKNKLKDSSIRKNKYNNDPHNSTFQEESDRFEFQSRKSGEKWKMPYHNYRQRGQKQSSNDQISMYKIGGKQMNIKLQQAYQMLQDDNSVPDKPNISMRSKINKQKNNNNNSDKNHQNYENGRNNLEQNQINQYYHRDDKRSKSRSKSRQKPNKQSNQRLQQMKQAYLQKLNYHS